jgi:serine protease AprX
MFHYLRSNYKPFIIYPLVVLLIFSWLVVPAGNQSSTEFGSFIVRGTSAETTASLVESYGGVVTSHLDIINGVGALLPLDRLPELAADPGGLIITPNAIVMAADNGFYDPIWPETDYPNVVGADIVWSEGVLGEGVTVAILDTGMSNHLAINRDIYGKRGRIVGWKDFVDGRPNLYDPNGHGTHVAGIIGATQIGTDGEWNGVAPGINLLPIRVLNRDGFGTYEQVIEGIDWVWKNKDTYKVRVMNLSLVALAQSPYWADPLNIAVMEAWAADIVVVAAAGNGGPNPMTIGVPGNVPYVITVGAFTDAYTPDYWGDDYLAPFSAAGPTLDGFVKPDVVAPGAHMVAPMNPGAQLALTYPDNKVISQYFSMAGTSQAAGVVSGIAALILDNNPLLSPDQVKYRIMVTALPWLDIAPGKEFPKPEDEEVEMLYSMWQQGAGRVNAVNAVFPYEDELTGFANFQMDIHEDLGGNHYQGFTYYDSDTDHFRLMVSDDGDFWSGQYGAWSGDYGLWTGQYGAWSGQYGAWSGQYGAWSGQYGAWSGQYGAWSGQYGAWSGQYGAWSGQYGAWSGGYGAWSGQYGAWSGGDWDWEDGNYWTGDEPWCDTELCENYFIRAFLNGESPDALSTITSLGDWVGEPLTP